ncbi:MAG: phytanoyl-CoA dioxygenase family protein [Chloroflexi bacterium]|nr:phytanoyl-CoA dioxygenase family protein [Chloroflexota bacterium]
MLVMLTDKQLTDFKRSGCMRLCAAFSEFAAQNICQHIWNFLAQRSGVHRDDPTTWAAARTNGFQALTQSHAFDELAGTALTNAFDHILGHGRWQSPQHWGMPLITFPQSKKWRLPHSHWHLDFAARRIGDSLPGLRALAFLAPVESHGGGTLVLEGSHTLVERLVTDGRANAGHSADIRKMLARSNAWLRALWNPENADSTADSTDAERELRFMIDGTTIDGVHLRVVELTGAPGDAVVMHPWTLHAASPNCAAHPRMMLSSSVFTTP